VGLTAALSLGVALRLAAWRTGPLPALGPFLDPWSGVWSVAASANLSGFRSIAVPGLHARVRVVYDDRGVPHIFAGSAEDAARSLGYVVARDRLFQLEMRWRTTAGRLSELLGPDAIDFDRRMRGLGLAWSAERDMAALDRASPAVREIIAYAAGVNAYIDGLGRGDLPFEYHLLGARPARWEPVYSIYLLKLMGWDLSYPTSPDLSRLRLQAAVGEPAAAALIPVNSPIQQPIQPTASREPRFAFRPIPSPGRPGARALKLSRELDVALGSDARDISRLDLLGSNNWAVAPARTAAGHALLAGDPHLGLDLPSIWYEAHLVVPGELDVYGVTIPSVPVIIIGFNRDVAWTFTNTGADVLDYYVEEVDDPESPRRYRLDGEWRPLESRVEEIRGPDGVVMATDTTYFSHRGPLSKRGERWLSMRWTVLEGAAESEALWGAMRASSVEGWLDAMRTFAAPAQNGLVADRAGTIAIRSTGHFPLQPDGSGLVVRDGTSAASDWTGFWPLDEYPSAVNPEQGYLASANQQPIDPRVDSTYLGAEWPSPWRALRINALLRGDSSVTPDEMRRFQTDPGNARADLFVPHFLDAVRALGPAASDSARRAAELLAGWDRLYTKENERAVLFEYAMDQLQDRIWDELVRSGGGDVGESGAGRVYTPAAVVTANLLSFPESKWWDDRRTSDVIEDRDAILAASLAAALREVIERHGAPEEGGWRWDRVRQANIWHLLHLRPLSRLGLPVQGGPGNLNPSSGSGTHGASWRMVVELGPRMRAWTIYPGGQSGNPVSALYADRIPKWVDGELEPAKYPLAAEDMRPADILARIDLTPGGE
jgi:penicillin amidase